MGSGMKPKVYKRGRVWECRYYVAVYQFTDWLEAIRFALRVAAGDIPDRFPVHIGRGDR